MWLHFKLSMLYTSFAPLWLGLIVYHLSDIIHIVLYTDYDIYSVAILLPSIVVVVVTFIFVISFIDILVFIRRNTKPNNNAKYKIVSAQMPRNIAGDFIAVYTLPMIAFDFATIKGTLLFLIFFLTISYLCIRYDYIYSNIILDLMGYKSYKCNLNKTVLDNTYEIPATVITNIPLDRYQGADLELWGFSSNYFIYNSYQNT